MLPGHELIITKEKAHPKRDCYCQSYTVVCACGWEKQAGVDDSRRVKEVQLEHRLDVIEQALIDSATDETERPAEGGKDGP